MPNFPLEKDLLGVMTAAYAYIITVRLGEVGPELVFLAVDDLLHFVLATNQLQVDKRCLIPA